MELSSRHVQNTQNLEVHNAFQPSDSPPSDTTSAMNHLSSLHLTTPSPSFFQNARNFEVKDTQFNVNTNVTITNNTTTNDPVSTILWSHVVAGAIFNSAERYAAGKCHPGTRKKIIERIVAWIEDPDPTQRILWIYGPAGAGKSAIAQTICELSKESHPDNGGGSFFFASGTQDRGNALKLFATLAYQLAIQFPSIRSEINNALSRDPSLPTKSMEIQLLSLIIQPLLRCHPNLSHSPVLIIDGLDECDNGNGTTQSYIVALIARLVTQHNVPLRFMILSRPEYWIRDAFDTPPLLDITLPLSLRDDVDADDDIRAYLTDEFERIRVENKRFMRSVVPPWPPLKIVERFVEEASGQYVYAATVLKFVGNPSKFSTPQKQLNIIINPGPHRALAFSELDRLYATIVSAYPELETMKRVLAALLLEANATIITVVLGVDTDELVLVLDALSSLIDIKNRRPFSQDQMFLESLLDPESLQDATNTMSFCHLSFREFLEDETRSGTFCVNPILDAVSHEIIKGLFGMVHRNLDQNYEIEPYIFCNINYITYHNQVPRENAIIHCAISFLLPFITRYTAKLELFDPRKFTHMCSVFYFLHDMKYIRSTLRARLEFKPPAKFSDKKTPEMLTELQTAWQNLDQAVNLAREEAVSALVLCTDFEATPAFVFLTEFWPSNLVLPLDDLHTIAGVTDVLSTLKRHHYIFGIWYDIFKRTWYLIGPPLSREGSDWRTQGAWRDIRITLAPRSLRSVLNSRPAIYEEYSDEVASRHLVLKTFFDSSKISDISNKEYFQNTGNLAMISTITDVEAWIGLLRRNSHPPRPYFFVSILRWINRQLTNPQTVTLLRNYDKTLQQTMVTVMNYIFEHGFLMEFTRLNKGELCVFKLDFRVGGPTYSVRSTAIMIKVWPLPKGFCEEEIIDPMSTYDGRNPEDWQTFHDDLFGKTTESILKGPIDPIIRPSQWHPHFLTTLLKTLVRFLYGQIHPDFSALVSRYEQVFPYIIPCLPYAHPTPKNLDALRAIVYLYPQVTPTWNPPEGLWPSIVDFLQKYDSSILSPEELRLFVAWLNSTKHEDIKTYIDN